MPRLFADPQYSPFDNNRRSDNMTRGGRYNYDNLSSYDCIDELRHNLSIAIDALRERDGTIEQYQDNARKLENTIDGLKIDLKESNIVIKDLTKVRDEFKTRIKELENSQDDVSVKTIKRLKKEKDTTEGKLKEMTHDRDLAVKEINKLKEALNIKRSNNNMKVEENDMKLNNMFGDFGAVKEGELALTITGGIAVKRGEDEFVRYNKETQQIENQMDMVVADAGEFMYVMPSPDVEEGDVVKVKNSYYQVLSVAKKTGAIKVVDIKSGTKKTVLKEINLFGMGFWSKVTCLFNMNGNAGMGGMNPMMLMMMSGKDTDGDGKDNDMMKTMMMMSAMQGMTGGSNNPMQQMNPMMLMMMMGKGEGKGMDMKDMMMMQMMSGGMINMFGQQPNITSTVVKEEVEEEDSDDNE